MTIPGELIPIVLFVMIGFTFVFHPIARALARRMDKQPMRSAIPPEVLGRLERIEQAVDAISIEVERISEGQRFTTQLLSEGRHQAGALPAGADRSAASR